MASNNIKPPAANVNKIVEFLRWFFPTIDHVDHVGSQDKRGTVTLKVSKFLSVSQKLSKVNVKQVTALFDHNVVIVSIANAQNVRRYTVSSTRT